ncbi:MAG: class I SAM-dependent methyltransferase [Halioglobus sp.]|nr:class I SAM-dependent methyltransferase [Halioglobus sp.]
MDDFTASSTALVTCRMRAVHGRLDAAPIIDDPWGDTLVPAAVLRVLLEKMAPERLAAATELADEELAQAADQFVRNFGPYGNVILRTRYTEEALAAAVARGVRQYVIIGAGFDSFMLRQPAWAQGLTIIEIDHPASQALKRRRLEECGIEVPANAHFTPADLGKTSVREALENSVFDPREPAFFAWLGVTMYLTRSENLGTLRSVAEVSAPGSEIAFSYMHQAVFDSAGADVEGYDELETSVRSVGEPLVSGFNPDTLEEDLASVGLVLLEGCTDAELEQRYDPQGLNKLEGFDISLIARAGPAA